MTIAIFGNSGKRETLSEVKYLLDFMQRHDVRVILSNELRSEMNLREEYPLYTPETDENIHFALSIGGDGTFLTTAMQVAEKGIPILGINCGHLGFLADVQTEEVEPIMLKLISGDFTIEERSMLEVTTSDDAAKRILNPFALNEVAILKQELALIVIGGVFVLDTLSCIIQIGSVKLRNKRVFPYTPIHYSFVLPKEKNGLGLGEVQTVHIIWAAAAVFAVLGLFIALH